MEWEQDDVRRLQFWYVRANAPQFLFDRLSADPLVMTLAASPGAEALVSELTAILEEQGSLQRNARAYALLVALALAAPRQAESLLSSERLTSLHWASAIIKIARDAHGSSSATGSSAKPESPAR